MKTTHVHLSDCQGCSQLAVQATLGVTDLVQAMHQTVLRQPVPWGQASTKAPAGLRGALYRVLAGTSGFVYDAVRGITTRVGNGIHTALTQLQPERNHLDSSRGRDAMISILNGVLGDHMEVQDNPLTIPMSLWRDGKVLELARHSLAGAIAQPCGKVLLLLHGHCMNELQWCRHGHDHGEMLAASSGFTPISLRYNTGLQISENGLALAP